MTSHFGTVYSVLSFLTFIRCSNGKGSLLALSFSTSLVFEISPYIKIKAEGIERPINLHG